MWSISLNERERIQIIYLHVFEMKNKQALQSTLAEVPRCLYISEEADVDSVT